MKKAIGIIILGLLWCNTSFAVSLEKCFAIAKGSEKYREMVPVTSDFESGNYAAYRFTVIPENGIIKFHWRVTDAAYGKWKILVNDPAVFQANTVVYKITSLDENIAEGESETKTSIHLDFARGIIIEKDKSYKKSYWIKYQCKTKGSTSSGKTVASSGSGFFINKKGYFVTNYHVIAECNDKSKITFKEKDVDAKLIAKDQSLDLALLRALVKPKNFLYLSADPPEKIQRIYVAGYPFGKGVSDDSKITQGIISSLKGFGDNSNEIQIDAAINPGNSGGPIVNDDGELIAVAVSGLAKDQSEGINFDIIYEE